MFTAGIALALPRVIPAPFNLIRRLSWQTRAEARKSQKTALKELQTVPDGRRIRTAHGVPRP